jgi:COP9 signalosome complex subunit 2
LKQIIKIQGRLGHPDEMVEAYRQLLQYASVVTRNAAEKKINSVLDYVSAQATDSRLLQDFYSLTLDSMAEAKNERLWFKTNMKLANLLVGMKEGAKAAKVGLA